jgi:UDPglucose--hexose-1-phosphate uridylyltransferase
MKSKQVGELRQDIITGRWVAVATGRAARPDAHHRENIKSPVPRPKYKDDCPFCNLAEYPQEPDVLRLPNDPDTWRMHIFGNKYPAFLPKEEFRQWNVGPYRAMESVGFHELLAPRWHNQTEAHMKLTDISLMIEALVLRYRQLKVKSAINYIQIIKNHGKEAGGSLEHPHHQIFSIPVLPDSIHDMLEGAERYAAAKGVDVFSTVLDFERETGERIIFENEHFTVFCPYASRSPFETWIMPREPEPFFENVGPAQRDSLAEAMQQIFRRLYVGLNDPAFNYFIYSAPCDETGFVCNRAAFQHFRWHIAIVPRLVKFGGFEISTELAITTALPEESAAWLREVDIALS